MTQESLANELGRGQSWVNHKLSGRRKANIEDIILIAKALEISPETLLKNVTNYDKLQDNFLGIAEEPAHYANDQLSRLYKKLEQLSPGEQEKLLEQFERDIDSQIDAQK